jgi:hypothetical protein
MTTIPHETPSDVPGATGPAVYDAEPHLAPARAGRTGRSLVAAALVFVGGYLVIGSFTGQLAGVLAGFVGTGTFVPVLYVAQFAFALVVVITGLAAAVGSGIGKLIGALIVVVGLAVTLAVTTLRLTGDVRMGVEAFYTIANPWLMTVLLVGIAWLLVRRARLGWLSLLAVALLSPVPQWLVLAGVDSVLIQLAMLFLSGIVGAGILAAGRPWRD